MFLPVLMGVFIIAFNVTLQAYGNVVLLRLVHRFFNKNLTGGLSLLSILKALIGSFLLFTVLHTLQTIVWAMGYFFNGETANHFSDFSEAIYFSMVTFTTLGYGDIVLESKWRILSGLEAINGIMLIGWSTAMMFSLIQTIYQLTSKKQSNG